MRLAVPLTIVVLAAALLSGCGGSSSSDDGSQGGSAGSATGASKAPLNAAAKSCDTNAGGVEKLLATGISCAQARRVMLRWQRSHACSSAPAGASRSSCTARSYRCLGASTDRGVAVSCARAGESIAFIAKRR
jgi:uncharacterized protein YceK